LPSAGSLFGRGCGTAGNPMIGWGSARDIQIELKIIF